MAGATDKARFFIEQSVPELKELERQKIFSSEEISSVARKRSDFEHKINARGSTPSDYARYAEFELNVDALRKKRIKRLGVKSTTHSGQRRVFFVFERGTKKHPGDVDLWMQYVDYARRQKAHKKLTQIFANVLRLHPTKPDLWIYAAQFAFDEEGSIVEARGYMQRGLRFCRSSKFLWLEYTRLELSHIAKIHARRRILGINGEETSKKPHSRAEEDENMLRLDISEVDPVDKETTEKSKQTLKSLDSTLEVTGAIPITVFDAAMLQFNYAPEVAYAFFQLAAGYEDFPAVRRLLHTIHDTLEVRSSDSWEFNVVHVHLPTVQLVPTSPEFPQALRESLHRLKQAQLALSGSQPMLDWARRWFSEMLHTENLDPSLKAIMSSKLGSLTTS